MAGAVAATLLMMTVCSTGSGDCVEDFARRFDTAGECAAMAARYRKQYEVFIARPAKATVAAARCKPAGASQLGLGRDKPPEAALTPTVHPRSAQFQAGMLLNSNMPASEFFPLGSFEGVLGLWYETTSLPPFASAFMLVHTGYGAATLMEASLENLAGSFKTLHLHLADLHNDWVDVNVESPEWQPDGKWHQVTFIWNTGVIASRSFPPYYELTIRHDGNIELFDKADVIISKTPPVPFLTPYEYSYYWSVGGDIISGGHIGYQYIGQMAELFGIFREGLYTDATAPLRQHSGLAEISEATGQLVPSELGIACAGVFGALPGLNLPALCMRGPQPYFGQNQYDTNPLSAFATYGGTVVTGSSDPWQSVH